MKIVKYSGDTVEFDREKLRNSLLKSGASQEEVQSVLTAIESGLYPGTSTKRIHRTAKQLLRRISHAHAARYDVRTGLQLLGPGGFYFEKFVAKLFESQGYQCKTNRVLAGRCVVHEIDLAIRKDDEIILGECKFHGLRQGKCDVKVPLYVLSRFNDVHAVKQPVFGTSDTFTECLIATNTRFTADATTFASCSGIRLLSWDHPTGNAIKDLVDRANLYPVTYLTTLTVAEKERLLAQGIVLVKELTSNFDLLQKAGVGARRKNSIETEVNELCNS